MKLIVVVVVAVVVVAAAVVAVADVVASINFPRCFGLLLVAAVVGL